MTDEIRRPDDEPAGTSSSQPEVVPITVISSPGAIGRSA